MILLRSQKHNIITYTHTIGGEKNNKKIIIDLYEHFTHRNSCTAVYGHKTTVCLMLQSMQPKIKIIPYSKSAELKKGIICYKTVNVSQIINIC